MRIIPAIFIRNGKVVSLYKGNINSEIKVYQKAPASYAELFQSQGAKTLFIIDLDGDQKERLTELRESFQGELWWAGKVRDMDHLTWLLENGADKIVLGQSAKPIFEEAIRTHGPKKLIAGLQVKHYDEAPDLCEALGKFGFTDIMMKDLNAEGTLFQPNFDLMEKCVYFSDANVFASGGVSKKTHLELLKRADVSGVIIARALYENQLNLEDLIVTFGSE